MKYTMRKRFILLLVSIIVFFFLLYGLHVYAKNNLGFNIFNLKKLQEKSSHDIATYLSPENVANSPIKVPDGFELRIFADLRSFGMPRALTFDSNSVLFVSLTQSGKVVALPDLDSDGKADEVKVVLSGLNKPHGIEFFNEDGLFKENVYIAETDKIVTYAYYSDEIRFDSGKRILDLPGDGRHYTRTIKIFDEKLYTSIGSSCDVCVENDPNRAAVIVSDLDGKNREIFASGLRNTVFFVFDQKGRMWGNDMGRDFLGDDLPPDELNIIEKGSNYGWPRCYGRSLRDDKYKPWESIDTCGVTKSSFYDYPAHTAPLGLTFINSPLFSKSDQGNILVAFHGSWNSSTPVGYKIIKLIFENETIIKSEDFISGFVTDKNDVLGRPVDLIFDKKGNLYISDDKAGVIYILTKASI